MNAIQLLLIIFTVIAVLFNIAIRKTEEADADKGTD